MFLGLLCSVLFLFAVSSMAATGTILYNKTQEGTSRDIFRMDLATGVEELVYAEISDDAYPFPSPDGSQIAFGCDAQSARLQLWFMNSDGTDATPAVSNLDLDLVYPTDWVGDKILANAYEPWGSGSRVMMYDTISETYTTLYSYPGRDCYSSQGILDDNWVIICSGIRYVGGGFELLKVSTDGSGTSEVLLSNNDASAGQGPSVSPDRMSVLFEYASTPGDYSIYLFDLNDNSSSLMVQNAVWPVWNEAGDSFIFDRDNDIWISDLFGNEEQITFDGVGRRVKAWTGSDDVLTLTLFPPAEPVIVPRGGSFEYDMMLESNLDILTNIDIWAQAILPNDNVLGIWRVNDFPIGPNTTLLADDLFQSIPLTAPSGDYVLRIRAGQYPTEVLAEDSFDIVISGAQLSGGADEWLSGGFGETLMSYLSEPVRLVSSESAMPDEYTVGQAYPNPFNPSTTISVTLPETSELSVIAYNVTGQQVAELANGQFSAGSHALTFDASGIASGLYFIRATVPGRMDQVQKVMLVR